MSSDPNVQQAKETDAARRILVDGEPVPDVAGVDPDADRLQDEPDAGQAPAEQLDPPAHSARKSEWIDHAERLGADRDEAEQLTVKELVAKYDRPAPAGS